MCLVDRTLIRCKRRDQTAKKRTVPFQLPFIPLRFLLLLLAPSSPRPRQTIIPHPVTQPGRRRSSLSAPLDPSANHHTARRLPRARAPPLPPLLLSFPPSFLPCSLPGFGFGDCCLSCACQEEDEGEGDGLHWPPRRRHAAALQVQRRRPLARRQVHPPALLVPIRQHLPAMVPVSTSSSSPLLSIWFLLPRPSVPTSSSPPLPNA